MFALDYGGALAAPVSVPTVIQFILDHLVILDHLEHDPLAEPVEPSAFVPSSRTTQQLLLFGFASGGRRRSEIVAATLENVRRDGQGGFVFELSRSKTNQSAIRTPDNFKPIVGEAAIALEAWLNELFRAGMTQGAIFRRLHNGRITEPLQDQAVHEIVRRRAKLVDPPIGEAMSLTGHRSVPTFIGYYRSGEATHSAAARLMDKAKK